MNNITLAIKRFKSKKKRFGEKVQPDASTVAAVYNVSMECSGVGIYRNDHIFRDGQSAHLYLEKLIRVFERKHPNCMVIKDIVLDYENDWRFIAKRSYFDDAEQFSRTTFKMERCLVYGQRG